MKHLLVFLLIAYSSACFANHVVGGEFAIRAIDSTQYEVKYFAFEDCTFSGSSAITLTVSAGNTVATASMGLSSSKDITLNCASNLPACASTSTSAQGLKMLTYLATINLSDSAYTAFLNHCKIKFSVLHGIRKSAYSQPGASYYNFIEIDRCRAPLNATPILANPPIHYIACNQALRYNYGGQDTVDNDSISYHWSPSYISSGQSYTYPSAYSYDQPIKTYFPNPLQFPYNNPLSTPPIGLFLNHSSGDFVFTPTDCNQVTLLCMRVKEWRKDSTGTYQVISEFNRDNILHVQTQATNTTPKIQSLSTYSVCEGEELCFTVSTSDTSTGSVSNDSTRLTWDKGIPSATFTINNANSKNQTATFCWTPNAGSASSRPYSFTATVKDNACPKVGFASKRINIKVGTKHPSQVRIDSLGCGLYAVDNQPDSGASPGVNHFWQVLDSTGSPIASNAAYFIASGQTTSTRSEDTLKIVYQGLYILRHVVEHPLHCTTVFYDTLRAGRSWKVYFSYTTDTLCPNDSFRMQPVVLNPSSALLYRWKIGGIQATDTTPYLDVIHPFHSPATHYELKVSDNHGCSDSITKTLFTYSSSPSLTETYETCGLPLTLSLDSSLSNIAWSDGAETRQWTKHQSGHYAVRYTDRFGCRITDSFTLQIHTVQDLFIGNDTTVCDSITYTISAHFASPEWHDGDSSRTRSFNYPVLAIVSARDSNNCITTDSVEIQRYQKHKVFIVYKQHCDSTELSIEKFNFSLWSNGDTGSRTWVTSSGTYWVASTDSNLCTTRDTLLATVLTSPDAPILTRSGDTLYSNYNGNHRWFRNDTLIEETGNKLFIDRTGAYYVLAVDSNACVSKKSNTIRKTTGIKQQRIYSSFIYPNPAHTSFSIDLNASISSDSHITIWDTRGRLLRSMPINASNHYTLQDLANGIYIVKIGDGKVNYHSRLIKR